MDSSDGEGGEDGGVRAVVGVSLGGLRRELTLLLTTLTMERLERRVRRAFAVEAAKTVRGGGRERRGGGKTVRVEGSKTALLPFKC